MATANPAEPRDPMEPASDPATAFASPLRTVTITTSDLVAMRRLLQGAFGLFPAFYAVAGPEAAALVAHWGLPALDCLEIVTFSRPDLPIAASVRVIAVPPSVPSSRPGYGAAFPGGLGVGFPVSGLQARESIIQAYGFRSAAGVMAMQFPRADGSTYKVEEAIFEGPDDVLALGVDRHEQRAIGPIDPALGVGAPAYSSLITGDAGALAPLLADVLGYERRREFVFESRGPAGGLQVPPGTKYRFQQWFAPGAASGYLVVMDPQDAFQPAPAPLGPASRGISMWTFEVPDVDAARARAERAGVTILRGPATVPLPGGGRVRSLMLATPDGFPIEIIERAGPTR
jgi:catechol 2,3-dioxygenase-like lactoylglutathione lyase family enzyme